MKVIKWDRPFATIELDEEELYIIENTLGTIGNFLHDGEFDYRAGAGRKRVEALSDEFTKLKYEMYQEEPPKVRKPESPAE